MTTNDTQLFFFVNFTTVCERSEHTGKVDYQGGHSSLFSGSQMMHVVTEKHNGAYQ